MKIEVSKKYGGKSVLDNLCMEIEEGKITSLLGESGSGKTTLLRIVAGLAEYEGKKLPPHTSACVFQEEGLLPNLTVEGNLKLVLNKADYGKIPDMLSETGLSGKEKRYPSTLSGGEKKRVELARAFLYPSDILLLDEPFSSLDLSAKKSLYELLGKIAVKKKKTALLVTHDVREAVLLSHKVYLLQNGKTEKSLTLSGEPVRDFFADYPEEGELKRLLLEK